MKILVTGLGKTKGGIGTLLLNMAKCNSMQSDADGMQFEFVLPKKSEYKEIFDSEGYRYYECPRLYNIIGYRSKLKKIISEEKYDYVWINNTSKVDIILPLLAKHHGTRVIQHSHGVSGEERGLKKFIFSCAEFVFGKKYETLIDIPIACSEASADYFYQDKVLRDRCTVLGNGIFTEKFRFNENSRTKIRGALNIKEDDILIGAVGRLTKVKNYPFLVRLIATLPVRFKGIVVGDGEDREMLAEMIQQQNLTDRFILAGQKNNIQDYLSAMDIFAMPSFNEGLPFSIVEAQCAGLTCIASTGISPECDLTGNVTFADINCQEEWVNFCLKYTSNGIERNNQCKKIQEKGYSIEETYRSFLQAIGVL